MKKRRKFTKGEKTALTVLGIIMAAVLGVGGYLIVNNVNTANREATNTTHTTSVIITKPEETEEQTGATEKYASKPKKKKAAEKTTSAAEKATSAKQSETKATETTKSKAKSSSKPKTDSNGVQVIPKVKPTENTSHKSNEKCVVNGVTCYVGDTITVTLNLKSSKILENYQGYTEFDKDYLKFKTISASTGFANNKGNKIYYNTSIITGLDFTSTGTVYTATFEVKKSGSTKIKNTFELLTDMDQNDVSPDSVKDTITVYS